MKSRKRSPTHFLPGGARRHTGDLHLHTDWSDGLDTVEDMVAEAMRRGYSYVAVSIIQHTTAQHGLSAERLLANGKPLRRYKTLSFIAILKARG